MWYDWLDSREKTEGTRNQLQAYAAVATGHFPRYLSRLEEGERLRMQRYAFPPLPPDMTRKQLAQKQVRQDQQVRRKEQSDILVPLYPVLRQLVRFRKQVAERLQTCSWWDGRSRCTFCCGTSAPGSSITQIATVIRLLTRRKPGSRPTRRNRTATLSNLMERLLTYSGSVI